jgi:RNA-directed DNA polymerase
MSGVCEKIEVSDVLDEGKLNDIRYFNGLISYESLLVSWRKFSAGKWHQPAVREFWLNLENELYLLYHDLALGRYCHGNYRHFVVCDPKRRDIYVADVRDRIVHQLIFDYLNEIYESKFYFHSYASRADKGLHKAISYFLFNYFRLSRSREVYSVKMDIKKYFSNIDHNVLLRLLSKRVKDRAIWKLLVKIINSFGLNDKGLPLGNLTSQVLANIYLHELDFYIKNNLRIKHYLRYNDDLIFLSHSFQSAKIEMNLIREFVNKNLLLEIPITKIVIVSSPKIFEFLGWQTDGNNFWVRQSTKRRANNKLKLKYCCFDEKYWESACSYHGLLPEFWEFSF